MDFSVNWYSTIKEIGASEWTAIFGEKSIIKSYNLHQAVEEAGIPGVKHFYLKIASEGRVLAIIPAFTYRVVVDILASKALKGTLDRIREVFPNILTQKIFFVGSPIAICGHLWGIGVSSSDKIYSSLAERIIREIKDKAKIEKYETIIVREIPAEESKVFERLLGDDFTMVETLPNSYIPLFEGLVFPNALRKKYRRRIINTKNHFIKSNFYWTIETDFAKYSEDIYKLYRGVLENSNTRFESLNSAFFKKVSQAFKDNSYVLLCFNPEHKLVCFELILEEEEFLIPLYLGLDYEHRDKGDIYFNCIYRVIEEAEKRNKKLVVLGQTSYLAKAYAGAVFQRLYLGVCSTNVVNKWLIKKFTSAIFPPMEIPVVHCYEDKRRGMIEQVMDLYGISHVQVEYMSSSRVEEED